MQLSRIRVYPIKSLDPLELREAEVTALGALRHDREWALIDERGSFVNGKSNPLVHRIRARYSDDARQVTLSAGEGAPETHALDDAISLSAWFSQFFNEPIRLIRDEQQGFPDDLKANGPTLVGELSLVEVASWFGLQREDIRRRFRTNLEFEGAPMFWEDRLFKQAGEFVEFRIGKLKLLGVNPCRRCAVPARDPDGGEITRGFQKRFMQERERTLPPWAERSHFDHFYRFAVNTRIAPGQLGKRIRIGDPVFLPGLKP